MIGLDPGFPGVPGVVVVVVPGVPGVDGVVVVVVAGVPGDIIAGGAWFGGVKPIVTHHGGVWYAQQQQLESDMILNLPL